MKKPTTIEFWHKAINYLIKKNYPLRHRHMLHLLVLGLVIAFGNTANAQLIQNPANKSKAVAADFAPSVVTSDEEPFVVSITAGTTGIGAEVKRMFAPKFDVRLGYSFLPKISVVRSTTTDFNSNTKVDGNFSNVHLLAEYAPFNGSWIRVVGGAAYILELKTTIDQTPTGNYSYGDITFTPDQIGTIHTLADWKGLAWYGGVSFFKMVPAHRVNVTLDLGTYYLTDPKTSITATNMLAQNANESNQINWHENISQYRWLPVLQLNLNIKIGK